ncbi:MAG: nicotinate-nucleotide adenylyltransferase [Clostridiales Family XIII bacterium]|jgi:nicotinate-nucleotide adenylyltransferase|nr:nicotinate-nucleotide adenylyltransferase [Clostridiales Family XIII bacterium]
MLKIGVFGGSFDPVHVGHLAIAEAALEGASLDRLLFMPVHVQPFKKGRRMAEGRHRLRMLELATAGRAAFGVTDLELRAGGVSYTVDSLRALRESLPVGSRLYFLLGADMFGMLEQWRGAEEMLREFAFIVAPRRGGEALPQDAAGGGEGGAPEMLRAEAARLKRLRGTEVVLLDMPLVDASSTEIKRRIREGEDVGGLAPPEVARYIKEHQLYVLD